MKYKWIRDYGIAFVTFVVTTFIFFRPHLLGKAYFWDDFIEQVYPNRVFAGKSIASGHIPHWNPYSFCGMPFQADVQTALYYPPYFIFDRLVGAQSENGVWWLQLVIIMHFVLAQAAMYLLLRQLGVSWTGGMLGAVSYAFSAPLALHTHHPMFIEHLAWLPLLVLFLHRAIVRHSFAAIGWGSVIGGTMLLSGAPQLSLYALTLCLALGLWWSLSDASSIRTRISNIVRTVTILGLSVGIYAVQFFPSRQLAAESERATLSYDQATEGSLEWASMLTALVPKAFGIALPHDVPNKMPYYHGQQFLYWDTAFYFGVGILLLAIWTAIVFWKESSLIRALSVIALVAIMFALGSNGVLYGLIYHLPFFGQFRIPARMLFTVAFCGTLIAALGWDRISTTLPSRARTIWLIISLIALLIMVAVGSGVITAPPERIAQSIRATAWSQLLYALAFSIGVLLRMQGIRQSIVGSAVIVLTFFDLYSAHSAFSQGKINPAEAYRAAFPDSLRQILLPSPPENVFRVSMRRPEMMALFRNQGLVDGIMLFEGYNQLLLRRRHPAVSSPELVADMLSIRWALGRDSIGRWAFLPRPSAYPMAWLVHKARVVEPDRVAEVMRNDTTIDYRTEAIIEEDTPYPLGSAAYSDSIRIMQYENDRVRYYVRVASPALAIFSEVYYPAWNAYLDGKPVPLLRANYCLRAVFVPSGTHTIELRYESKTFATGSLVTGASVAAAVVFVILSGIRRIQSRFRNQKNG
ncbi:MAG: YfhO family protein [Candidatus Kapabacteria bacterium]|nr:YfhO family protein [Candidatus Kapabacteria bacterium]